MTAIVPVCAYCRRPICDSIRWAGRESYHFECTQPPRQQPPLTDADVRRIVREEILTLEKIR